MQFRVRRARLEAKVARATFRIESERDGNRLEQRRLSGAVLADEERDRWMQRDALEVSNRRQVEWVSPEVWNTLSAQHYLTDEPGAHASSSSSSPAGSAGITPAPPSRLSA